MGLRPDGHVQSGFTQGLIGVGVDAHAYQGMQLDSGGGRAGKARLLSLDNDGHPKSEYSRGGAALKLRVSNTVLSWGEQRVKTPVFSSSDSRLLPETATGLFLTSSEIDNLKLVAGHFNESTDRNASSHDQGFVVNYSDGRQGNSFELAGLVWNPGAAFSGSLYTSRYEDTWNQHYLGSTLTHAMDDRRSLSLDLNLYRTTDTGKALSGRIDNTTWSLVSRYNQGPHSYSLGWQQVDGNTPFDYVTRGAIYIANAVQMSDFNAPNEKSWQARYDLNMGGYGIPGLNLTALYVRGFDIDGTHVDPNGGYAYLGYGRVASTGNVTSRHAMWCRVARPGAPPSRCGTTCTAATRRRRSWMAIRSAWQWNGHCQAVSDSHCHTAIIPSRKHPPKATPCPASRSCCSLC